MPIHFTLLNKQLFIITVKIVLLFIQALGKRSCLRIERQIYWTSTNWKGIQVLHLENG